MTTQQSPTGPKPGLQSVKSLAQALTQWVGRSPDSPVVVDRWGQQTYAELHERTVHLARRLESFGVGPREPVAVVVRRDRRLLEAVLAVQATGGVCLPIASDISDGRRNRALAEVGVRTVVTTPRLCGDRLWPSTIDRVVLDRSERTESGERLSVEPPPATWLWASLGSQGGMQLASCGSEDVLSAASLFADRLGLVEGDRLLSTAPAGSGLSLLDLMVAMPSGATLWLLGEGDDRDGVEELDRVIDDRFAVWSMTPPAAGRLLKHLAGRGRPLAVAPRAIVLSGGRVSPGLRRRLKEATGGARIVVAGSVDLVGGVSAVWEENGADGDLTWPWGDGLEGRRIDVLDRAGKPCPNWATGELSLVGAGLPDEILGDEGPCRLITGPDGEPLLATGLVGQWLPGEQIECFGPAKPAVDLDGVPYALAEIEAVIARLPGVEDVRVGIVPDGQDGRRIAAQVVPVDKAGLDLEALREQLTDRIDDELVPADWSSVESLPTEVVAAGGELPTQLRRPTAGPTGESDSSSAVRSATEARFLELARELLGSATVALNDDLLAIGANSVDMIRLGNLIEDSFGVRIDPEDLFLAPRGVEIAGKIDELIAGAPAPEASSAQTADDSSLILDPDERDSFKKRRLGLRDDLAGHPSLELTGREVDQSVRTAFLERSSFRRYSSDAIPLASIGTWLACLRSLEIGGRPKYKYPSAGGLYPVQVYLHVKAGRIADLGPGTYYYDPTKHQLVSLRPGVEIDRGVHDWINRGLFDAAGFSLFLVGRLQAIQPMYGAGARDFMLFEAGAMGQLLMTEAFAVGLGLCGIGGLRFESIRHLLSLDEDHLLLHSFVGGLLPANALEEVAAGESRAVSIDGEDERVEAMLARLESLSDEEVQALLSDSAAQEEE